MFGAVRPDRPVAPVRCPAVPGADEGSEPASPVRASDSWRFSRFETCGMMTIGLQTLSLYRHLAASRVILAHA